MGGSDRLATHTGALHDGDSSCRDSNINLNSIVFCRRFKTQQKEFPWIWLKHAISHYTHCQKQAVIRGSKADHFRDRLIIHRFWNAHKTLSFCSSIALVMPNAHQEPFHFQCTLIHKLFHWPPQTFWSEQTLLYLHLLSRSVPQKQCEQLQSHPNESLSDIMLTIIISDGNFNCCHRYAGSVFHCLEN